MEGGCNLTNGRKSCLGEKENENENEETLTKLTTPDRVLIHLLLIKLSMRNMQPPTDHFKSLNIIQAEAQIVH